ncbi:hypothetical protein Syun_021625 [Stephania yunnanensis]|uniref:Protein kinase domain-containing protein n=1 Tax=Stephania yunnanensis TaxID=152371 RepID=A0AAP0IGY7_9MAGN
MDNRELFYILDGVDEEGEEDDGGEEDEKGLGNHRISGAAENTWYSRASSVRDQSAIKDDAKLERWFGLDLLRAFLDAGIYSFDLEDLLRASAEVLGKGSVGTSYKAVLEEGTTVVVKRLKDVVVTKREFEVQMEGLRKVNHENIVPLRAFYYSKDEKLLVYDFMPAGSLSALLHARIACYHLIRFKGVHTTATPPLVPSSTTFTQQTLVHGWKSIPPTQGTYLTTAFDLQITGNVWIVAYVEETRKVAEAFAPINPTIFETNQSSVFFEAFAPINPSNLEPL